MTTTLTTGHHGVRVGAAKQDGADRWSGRVRAVARASARRGGPVDVAVTDPVVDPERAALFRQYVMPELQLLHAMAMRLTRDPHEAEDLVQDTLLRAHRAIDRFDGRYPRAWLLTILRNTHINRIRRKSPSLAFDPDTLFGQLPAAQGRDTVAEDALDRIADPVLVEALRMLSTSHRAVVTLVDIEGLSYKEAADLLEVPIGTVMSRLHRARRNLRRSLEKGGHVRKATA